MVCASQFDTKLLPQADRTAWLKLIAPHLDPVHDCEVSRHAERLVLQDLAPLVLVDQPLLLQGLIAEDAEAREDGLVIARLPVEEADEACARLVQHPALAHELAWRQRHGAPRTARFGHAPSGVMSK